MYFLSFDTPMPCKKKIYISKQRFEYINSSYEWELMDLATGRADVWNGATTPIKKDYLALSNRLNAHYLSWCHVPRHCVLLIEPCIRNWFNCVDSDMEEVLIKCAQSLCYNRLLPTQYWKWLLRNVNINLVFVMKTKHVIFI